MVHVGTMPAIVAQVADGAPPLVRFAATLLCMVCHSCNRNKDKTKEMVAVKLNGDTVCNWCGCLIKDGDPVHHPVNDIVKHPDGEHIHCCDYCFSQEFEGGKVRKVARMYRCRTCGKIVREEDAVFLSPSTIVADCKECDAKLDAQMRAEYGVI